MRSVGGHYDSSEETCVLCLEGLDGGMNGPKNLRVAARHEGMHQFLTEVLRYRRPTKYWRTGIPGWAEEGLAEYFGYLDECPWRRQYVPLTFGHRMESAVRAALSTCTTEDWCTLVGSCQGGYPAYGLVETMVEFLLESNSGQYEADFLEFLLHSKHSEGNLLHYIGLTRAEFAAAVKKWALEREAGK